MAEITKTVIYPIPTEWYSDTQDTNMSGICTYTGPDRITIWYRNIGTDENPKWTEEHSFPSDEPEDRKPPIDCRVVELNARTHTMNAIALWGGIEGPMMIETPAGPDTEPNPILNDYHHFHEVFDMCSFHYNFETESWNTGRFSGPHTEEDEWSEEGEVQKTFGWDAVRSARDALLRQSDNKIPVDAPEEFARPWREYRQKLRDITNTWASVGDKTYLIVWPREPGDIDTFTGESPETGLDSTDTTTEGA